MISPNVPFESASYQSEDAQPENEDFEATAGHIEVLPVKTRSVAPHAYRLMHMLMRMFL